MAAAETIARLGLMPRKDRIAFQEMRARAHRIGGAKIVLTLGP